MAGKTFPLDSTLGAGAAANLELSGATSADVARAVASRSPIPTRADGVLELGTVGLSVASGSDLRFTAGATKVGVSFSAGVVAGIGVYDDASKALEALALGETPGLTVALDDDAQTRFAVLRARYSGSGSAKGTHPIGAVGVFTFGASASADGVTAVLQAFEASASADAVLGDLVTAWKLPRHVSGAADLPPRTWLVAEANGSISVSLGAQVGYDFSFVREAKAAGLSGDVGLKIDAAATASIGVDVSGRYLVVVGRESDAERVRVRLFKLTRRGVDFGLNLKVGVRGVESASPEKIDDFVKAVFGVHGVQVMTALGRLEHWTDPSKSVGELVAGLSNDKALTLLKSATGVDAEQQFDAARAKLTNAITLWQQLPERASSEVLRLLGGLDASALRAFRASLDVLTSGDEATLREGLLALWSQKDFDKTPAGGLLLALADTGLLSLLDRLPEVRRAAGIVADLLDGDVIRRLQGILAESLDLNTIVDAVTQADFDTLDSFLVGRLAAFLDRAVSFADLDEIRKTINVVLAKRQEIYAKARKALTTRYGAEIANVWQRTTSDTAVLDVEIDTSTPAGASLLTMVLCDGDFDGLLASTSSAVTFHAALLTHETRRKSTMQVTLPKLSFKTEHANTSLAGVSVHEDGGRLLLYQADASDVVSDTRRRYRSSLTMGLTTAVTEGAGNDLRIHGQDRATWSYQLLHARGAMQRGELEMYTRPFLERYMRDRFGAQECWSQWFTELDQTVEGLLSNGPDQFGDTLLEMDVTTPAAALFAWMHPLPNLPAASKAVSRAIQRALKAIIPFYYLQDPSHLAQNPSTAALLVWAAMPTATSARVDGTRLSIDAGKSVYWDHQDRGLRGALAHHPLVAATLGQQFVPIRLRLQELGLGRQAAFFTANEVPDWIEAATSDTGDRFLWHLCQFEALTVEKAVDALKNMQAFLALKAKAPSKAIDRLADFGADITLAFNKLAGETVFAQAPLRVVTQSVFLDASRALATMSGMTVAPMTASGMLTLTVLKPESARTFEMAQFLSGERPASDDVLVEQRLVSALT